MFNNAEELLRYISDESVEYVDIRFCDLPGVMQHLTVPATSVNQDFIDEGIAFDGSSVRGFQAINESDMILLPDSGESLSDVCRELADGFYGLPRFELPEWLWEQLPRSDPRGAMSEVRRLGPLLHPQAVTSARAVATHP